MNSIPTDLINQILSRLPAKSIARFRCVSKLWGSMLCSPYFNELFLTSSPSRPRLLFLIEKDYDWFFFSTPQPQNPYEKSSLVVAVDSHIKSPKDRSSGIRIYASGLIYFSYLVNLEEIKETSMRMICNPSTGQYAILPLPEQVCNPRRSESYLGFDPIDKQFKVLFMNTIDYMSHKETVHHISTLGTGELRWRNIQCPFTHELFSDSICINGILYYKADETSHGDSGIVCFDVRSEKFKFVDRKEYWRFLPDDTLINYKEKLGVIRLTYDFGTGELPLKLLMWVLEDVEKHEWSKHVYTLWDTIMVKHNLSVAGMTATSEIVLSMNYACKPFYVFYFNPERNTLRKVEIQGIKEEFNNEIAHAFVDHVEDLNFNVMKTTTSTSPKEEKRKPTITSASSSKDHKVTRNVAHLQQDRRLTYESANKFNALCLLDDDDEFYRY